MSGSVNKCILIGHLGRDPEIRSTQGGSRIANLRIATSETWKDKGTGERQERTEWHAVVIFNERLVEVAERYLKKGAKVYLEGSLQTRKWTDQSGAERYTTEVVLQRFRGELVMLDGRSGDADDSPSSSSGYGVGSGYGGGHAPSSGSRSRTPADPLDDDIPFHPSVL